MNDYRKIKKKRRHHGVPFRNKIVRQRRFLQSRQNIRDFYRHCYPIRQAVAGACASANGQVSATDDTALYGQSARQGLCPSMLVRGKKMIRQWQKEIRPSIVESEVPKWYDVARTKLYIVLNNVAISGIGYLPLPFLPPSNLKRTLSNLKVGNLGRYDVVIDA